MENFTGNWLACTQTLPYFSFRFFRKHGRARKARKKNKHDSDWSVFFLLHYYPLALAVNISPAAFIFYHTLDGLWRENRGSGNRLQIGRLAHLSRKWKPCIGFWRGLFFAILCMCFFIALLVWSCMINLLSEGFPFVLLNYSEQIALRTITDSNFKAFFCLRTIYNNINNNDKIRIMNGYLTASPLTPQ